MTSRQLNADFAVSASNSYRIERLSDYTLQVCVPTRAASLYHTYDFVMRVLTTQHSCSNSSPHVTPFSRLDRESLAFMHAQLVALGGTPPALPAPPDEKSPTVLSKPRIK